MSRRGLSVVRLHAITGVLALAIFATAAGRAAAAPPQIGSLSTYIEGPLVFLVVPYSDADGDAVGFGFRGIKGSGWAEESHPFTSPSYGRVTPGQVAYPFNHNCSSSATYQSDVEFWIYDAAGTKTLFQAHLSCQALQIGIPTVCETTAATCNPAASPPPPPAVVVPRPNLLAVSMTTYEHAPGAETSGAVGELSSTGGPGELMVIRVAVTNTGSTEATGVKVRVSEQPAGSISAVVGSPLADNGTCQPAATRPPITVACDVNRLSAGATATISYVASIIVRNVSGSASRPTNFVTTARVTADQQAGETFASARTGIKPPEAAPINDFLNQVVAPCLSGVPLLGPYLGVFYELVINGSTIGGALQAGEESLTRVIDTLLAQAGITGAKKVIDPGKCIIGLRFFLSRDKMKVQTSSVLRSPRPVLAVRSQVNGSVSVLLARARAGAAVSARAQGATRKRVLFRARYRVRRGPNRLKLRVPRTARRTTARLTLTLRDRSGKVVTTTTRTVSLRFRR